jgi:hypothetical protein
VPHILTHVHHPGWRKRELCPSLSSQDSKVFLKPSSRCLFRSIDARSHSRPCGEPEIGQQYNKMPLEITPIREGDIPGAVDCIQKAFADDPYNHWVFDQSKVRFSFSSPSILHSLFNALSVQPRCLPIQLTTRTVLLPPQPRLLNPPLPMGHQERPLPRRQRPLLPLPLPCPWRRNVDAALLPLRSRTLAPLPLLLAPLVPAGPPQYPVLGPRRPERETVLDLEGETGQGAGGSMDGREGLLFLQYSYC